MILGYLKKWQTLMWYNGHLISAIYMAGWNWVAKYNIQTLPHVLSHNQNKFLFGSHSQVCCRWLDPIMMSEDISFSDLHISSSWYFKLSVTFSESHKGGWALITKWHGDIICIKGSTKIILLMSCHSSFIFRECSLDILFFISHIY